MSKSIKSYIDIPSGCTVDNSEDNGEFQTFKDSHSGKFGNFFHLPYRSFVVVKLILHNPFSPHSLQLAENEHFSYLMKWTQK